MKRFLAFSLALMFSVSVFGQTGLDKIGADFTRHQPYPKDLQQMVDILTSPFIVVKSTGDLYGFTTYAAAETSSVFTSASDVILSYGQPVIDTGFVHYWAAGGAVVVATAGTDAACSDGDRYWVELHVTQPTVLTGISYLVGSVGGTDSVIVELFNASGTLLATSDTTRPSLGRNADIVGTAAQFQSVAFDIPYYAKPGVYYVSVQFDGTTAKFRAYPVAGSKFVAGTASGTFGTEVTLTPGTTFTADKGPILHTY